MCSSITVIVMIDAATDIYVHIVISHSSVKFNEAGKVSAPM